MWPCPFAAAFRHGPGGGWGLQSSQVSCPRGSGPPHPPQLASGTTSASLLRPSPLGQGQLGMVAPQRGVASGVSTPHSTPQARLLHARWHAPPTDMGLTSQAAASPWVAPTARVASQATACVSSPHKGPG